MMIFLTPPTPGVATIPRAPEEVSATAENDTSVTVNWARALDPDTARTLDHYTVNLTFVTYVSLPSTIYYVLSTNTVLYT